MGEHTFDFLREKLREASNWVYLGPTKVGEGHEPYFIAEIGINHNGDFYLAKRHIEEAAKAGAHAVKFQKRSIKDVAAKELRDKPQTKDEIRGKTYGEYREALELSLDEYRELKKVAEFHNVTFFATATDRPSVDFLEQVGVPFYKVASFHITDLPLLDYIASKGKPIILSTGTATLEETDEAVATILKHHHQLILLHCVSVYPSPDETINLNTMKLLRRRYDPLPIGYSGHEQDILPTLAAVAHGATVIERHFTLSRTLPGPDHATVSIEAPMFEDMVLGAKRIRKMFGRTEKEVLAEERTVREKHHKSIVAAVHIPKGALITAEMLTVKSPGYGFQPRDIPLLIGQKAALDIAADTVIRKEDIAWEAAISKLSGVGV